MFHIRINGCRVSFVQSTQTNNITIGWFFLESFLFIFTFNASSFFMNSCKYGRIWRPIFSLLRYALQKGFKSTETYYCSGEMWLLQAICCPLKSQQLQLDLKMVSWAHYELIVKGEESCYCALAHFSLHTVHFDENYSKKTGTFIKKINWCKPLFEFP